MYNTFKLEALPLNHHKILKLPANTAMTSENRTYFINKQCQRIVENFICTSENLLDYTLDGCYSKLLRGKPGNCTFENYNDKDVVKRISDNHVVLKSRNYTRMRSTCGVANRKIKGTFLIEFHNCSVIVNETTFTNSESIHSDHQFILPLQGIKISEQEFEESLTIADLQIENRSYMKDLTQTHQQHTITSFGISTTSLLLVIIIVIYLLKARNFRLRICNKPSSKKPSIPEINTDPGDHTHRDVASSDGGVVTDQSSPIILYKAPESVIFAKPQSKQSHPSPTVPSIVPLGVKYQAVAS